MVEYLELQYVFFSNVNNCKISRDNFSNFKYINLG